MEQCYVNHVKIQKISTPKMDQLIFRIYDHTIIEPEHTTDIQQIGVGT